MGYGREWLCLALLGALACGGGDSTSVSDYLPAGGEGPGGGSGAGGGDDQPNNNNGGEPQGSDHGSGGNWNPGVGGGPGDDSDKPCETVAVRASPVAPDVLIVLDRSASMVGVGPEGGQRWEPSVSALKKVTSELQSVIRFGLMTFPVTDMVDFNDLLSGGCGTGGLVVPIAGGNASDIAAGLDRATPRNGQTPTGPALREALKVLGPYMPAPDEVVSPKYVLLVTDGRPACNFGGGQVDQPQIDAAYQAVEALNKAGIPTYVVGYDVAAAADVMDGLAQRGGTEKYIPVDNEDTLVTEMRKIAGKLAPCEYQLEKSPEDPDYVFVQIDGKQVHLRQEDGWVIEGNVIKLQGGSCASVQDGREHAIAIEVRCDPVVVH